MSKPKYGEVGFVPKSGERVYQATSVYDKSLDRIRALYDRFDYVFVCFSGGKDSTACLQLALQIAKEKSSLPLIVVTFDEEAIPPETVEYMDRVRQNPDIDFRWMCVPIEHRNACSKKQPYWYPWAEEDKAKWVRPLPEGAITSFPGMTRSSIEDQIAAMFPASMGIGCNIMGIRTQESASRYRAIVSARGESAYIKHHDTAKHLYKAYPIYDWTTEDVWKAPKLMGWDYNKAYDLMEQSGLSLSNQRCSPPFGEQPIRRLHTYKTCWPDLWAKMTARVHGAATAARYANTDLYGYRLTDDILPEGMTWRQFTMETIKKLSERSRQEVAEAIKGITSIHQSYTTDPIPDADPHPVSGVCWKVMSIGALAGGNKFGRQGQRMNVKARDFRRNQFKARQEAADAG